MKRRQRRFLEERVEEHYWPSFTDMMSMVVLVFLFIAIIAFVQSIYNAYEQTQVRHELSKATNIKKHISDVINKKLEDQVGRDKIIRGPNNTISIQGSVLFDSASSEISTKGKTVLKNVADGLVEIINDKDLSQYIYIIQIEGHTDDVPYDNWTLSSERAVSVLKYLQTANPKLSEDDYAKYLAVTGYSKYKPAVKGNTESDRSKNRRISFQIILDDNKWQNKIKDIMLDK
ncbi:chemotaxis protein MotB [Pullulanibacillus pueri]|uniref:Chemotaxis protein MotB n=1 Tax=Pullulanibacillus pueri TaxID=1437324 RepID=A0A8J2ZYL3_9BACL|nr:OmpA family protein [Pullulanibacillus pueri]MBM7683091.1 chemotaxis protein MotB [Pullulanibacillus pueri]GGH84835.1 chemotaxis protein MotB [Pullulanibacillus pueri]